MVTMGELVVIVFFIAVAAVVFRGWVRAERWRARGAPDRFLESPDDEA
jgi:FtsZ-interacting cell division protein ZipA